MLDDNKKYWDNVYESLKENQITYDLWLDKFKYILDKHKNDTIIDLGCGSGSDTLYLSEHGFNILSCDYSKNALDILKSNIKNAKTLEIDITKKLPFKSQSISIIIADLSLHYFTSSMTNKIIKEIKRVLIDKGYLIIRVNSVNDLNFGFNSGYEIEHHYYRTQSGYKRFFDKDDLNYYFKDWNIIYLKEHSLFRFGMEKKTFEVVIQNIRCKNDGEI